MKRQDGLFTETADSSEGLENPWKDFLRPVLKPTLQSSNKMQDITNIALRRPRPEAPPEMEGWLEVKREGLIWESWKRFYCSLSDCIFKGMDQPTDLRVKFSLNFNLVTVRVFIVDDEIQIFPVGSSKSFHFKARSQVEFDAWAVALHCHITESVGAELPLIKTTQVRKYWRKNFITMEQLRTSAQTGDLLLFKSKSAGGFALRIISESDYDHVGMLVTLANGKLFLLEALGKTGVQLVNFEHFLANEWQRLYKKITHRPLICQRTSEFFDKFKTYTRMWIGKPYRLNMKQVMNTNPHTEEFSSFFCSELVAAMYMKLGLLSESVPAADYWPRSFSDKKLTHMSAVVRLGQEMPVMFDFV